MAEKFSPSQVQTVARYLTDILQNVVKPLQLECLAQAEVLNHMRQRGPDIANAIDIALNDARANPYARQELDREYRVALEKALQNIFGDSQDAEIQEQMRKDLGLVN